MSALGLLSAYGSSSDRDSDSEREREGDSDGDHGKSNLSKQGSDSKTDKSQNEPVSGDEPASKMPKLETKMRKKLPLPASVHNMFADSVQSENPDEHGGRKRSFPHERGNWATFVYIKYPLELDVLLREYANSALDVLGDGWQLCDEFHISLSRTVPVAHHCIKPLVDELKTNLENTDPVTVHLDQHVEFFTNDEKSRSFVSLRVSSSSTEPLGGVLAQVDKVFEDFRLQKYYENPSFHLSLAWKVGDATETANFSTMLQNFGNFFAETSAENGALFMFNFDEIYCKSGNKIMTVCLRPGK